MCKRIDNVISHNAEIGCTTITVTKADGSKFDVLMDSWVFSVLPTMVLHVKPMRKGYEDRQYPATYVDGKLTYLHRIVGEVPLILAAINPNNDRTTIDHLDRDPLNCQVANLRAASMREQNQNKGPRKLKVKPCLTN